MAEPWNYSRFADKIGTARHFVHDMGRFDEIDQSGEMVSFRHHLADAGGLWRFRRWRGKHADTYADTNTDELRRD